MQANGSSVLDDSEYCAIFVGGATPADVLAVLSPGSRPALGLEVTRGPVAFEVRPADDAGRGPAENFLFWPVKVDVGWPEHVPTRDVVPVIADMLGELWGAGFDATAACDFEDELPFSGGSTRPLIGFASPRKRSDDPGR